MKKNAPIFAFLLFASCSQSPTLHREFIRDYIPAKPLTVRDIFGGEKELSGKIPQGVKWSPDGRLVTFLQGGEDAEALDLWAYDLEKKDRFVLVRANEIIPAEKEQLSKEEEARRERARVRAKGIVSYHWSPEGAFLLFPLNGDLYLFDLRKRETVQLTKTEDAEIDPKFSKDEKYVSFIRNNELFYIDLVTQKEFQLTQGATEKIWNGVAEFVAQEEMGRMTGYWWSPGGDRIAYLQVNHENVPDFHIPNYRENRGAWETQSYPKAGDPNVKVKLGVLDLAKRETRWIALGPEEDIYIPRVHWHPDGKRLFYQKQSRRQDRLDLMIVELESGRSRLVHRETEEQWVDLHENFQVLPGGKEFLWTSQSSGWNHIYRGRIEDELDGAGQLEPVTSGSWDVKEISAFDPDAKTLYFIGTQKSHLERHLYAIGLDGKGLRRLSSRDGWHAVNVSTSFRYYLDVHSTATNPPSLSLHDMQGEPLVYLAENAVPELAEYQLQKPEFLYFESAEGLLFHARMIKPPGFDPRRKYPVLVYVYGGPDSQTVIDSWGRDRQLWHQLLAQRGYIVFSVDGRGTGSRGKEWSRKVYKNLGHFETLDQIAGAKYLQSLPYVDPSRIGIWGWSYGGYMTCLAMFHPKTPFKMGISVAPVTTWRNYDTHYTERYMGLPEENKGGYETSAPLTHAGGLKGKLLLVHGMADDNVHFQDSVQLIEALIEKERPFQLMVYPGKRHGISGHAARVHLFEMMTEYVIANL